jgi:HTH-type transcriptional regulator, competence development regulator
MPELKQIDDWFLAAAEVEASTPITAGAATVAVDAPSTRQSRSGIEIAVSDHYDFATDPRATRRGETEWLALAKLVELRRRQRRLSVEDLAKTADVDLEDIVRIEQGGGSVREPRTVHQIARVLDLPERSLLELAGLAQAGHPRFHEATVRFAARSEPVEALRPEELAALEEYVSVLTEP